MEFLLIAIILVSRVFQTEQTCLELNSEMKIELGKRLGGHVYTFIVVPQIYWCADLCHCETFCESFNYYTETGLCERSNISSLLLEEEAGSVYVKSMNIPGALAGVCREHPCQRDQKCRPFNGIPTCIPANYCYTMINGRGIYDGTISHTKSGYTCQRWDSHEFNAHYGYSDTLSMFPTDTSWDEIANHCRTPAEDVDDYPWCYTTNTSVSWEFCDIAQC